jgi:hypothetical protein
MNAYDEHIGSPDGKQQAVLKKALCIAEMEEVADREGQEILCGADQVSRL